MHQRHGVTHHTPQQPSMCVTFTSAGFTKHVSFITQHSHTTAPHTACTCHLRGHETIAWRDDDHSDETFTGDEEHLQIDINTQDLFSPHPQLLDHHEPWLSPSDASRVAKLLVTNGKHIYIYYRPIIPRGEWNSCLSRKKRGERDDRGRWILIPVVIISVGNNTRAGLFI